MEDKYKLLLFNLLGEAKEKATNSKCRLNSSQFLDHENRDYLEGYLFALYDILSIAKDQAEIFDIPLNEINLHDLDPDKDLL